MEKKVFKQVYLQVSIKINKHDLYEKYYHHYYT